MMAESEWHSLFFICFIYLHLAVFPTRAALSSTTAGPGTLSVLGNMTQGTCTCPGDSIAYTCTTVGGEATLWSGTAFSSGCDITLNHSRFSDIGGTSGSCSDPRIIGRSIERTNNCFTSQVTVTVNSDSINRTIECSVIDNSSSTSLVGTEVISTTDPFPPPDDFRLRSLFLSRLWFTWTVKESYRNCSSLYSVYVTNCTDICFFPDSSRTTISCSNISTVARICLFQLRITTCSNITGNASDPVYVTLKVPEAPMIINATISLSSFLDINFTQAAGFPVSNGVDAPITRYNITFMKTLTGDICGSRRIFTRSLLCQNGFCIDSTLIPSFCDGSAISIVISASNEFGSGPNSQPFDVKEIPGSDSDIESLRSSALQHLVGGVVGGGLTIIGALISLVLATLKLKGVCGSAEGGHVRELKVTTTTTTTVVLQWKQPPKVPKGVNAYKIEYSEDKPSSLKKTVEVDVIDTSFKITDLQPGTAYKINVKVGDTGAPTEIKANTKEKLYKNSIQVSFSVGDKSGGLTSILNRIISLGFKIRQIKSCPSTKPNDTEHHFLVNGECVCQATEDKKQMVEEVLKTKSCAIGISAKVESKVEADNNEEKVAEPHLLCCIALKSSGLHQAIIETVHQFIELDVKIDGIESYDSPNSYGIHTIYITCERRDEETKENLEARLKTCLGIPSQDEFLSITETGEDERDTHHIICKIPYERTIRVNFPLCQSSESRPLSSALQMFQKEGLSITYIDFFETTNPATDVQQTVVLEYKLQILHKEADGERDIVMTELKTTLKNASVEEVSCAGLSPGEQSKNYEHFGLEFTLEDSEESLTLESLKVLTDLGICIDGVSSALHKTEQHLRKYTLKCTTELVQLIQEEMMKNLKAIAFKNEVNLQVLTEAVPPKVSLSQASDASLAQVDDQALPHDQNCPAPPCGVVVAATRL